MNIDEKTMNKKNQIKIMVMAVVCTVLGFIILLNVINFFVFGGPIQFRKHFVSYDDFIKNAYGSAFPSSLPEGARDVEYYSYSVLGSKSYAVAFSTDADIYENMKTEAEGIYKKYVDKAIELDNNQELRCEIIDDNYVEYSWGEKDYYNKTMNSDIDNNKDYKFLKSLAKKELGEYRIVGYSFSGGLSRVNGGGVLANEEDCRLIYFFHGDGF